MTVDIVIPTMKKPHALDCIESLKHVPWPAHLHFISEGKSWPEAVNIGFKESSHDIILMDDDITLTEDTFKHIDKLYDKADIFGFKLCFPGSNTVQHAGGCFRNGTIDHLGYGIVSTDQFEQPLYTCHVTTSLIYIKRHVLDKLIGIDEGFPGYQFEDVDFNFRALKAGLKILYTPGMAYHAQSLSKRSLPDFQIGFAMGYNHFKNKYYKDEDFIKQISAYPTPLNLKSEENT